MIDRGLSVPTATLGSSGVNKKKFFGLITIYAPKNPINPHPHQKSKVSHTTL